jgi:ABC-type nitrate/sulfonate/bicarbonate transport system permease component
MIVLLMLLAAWQSYIWVSHTPSYVLPTPGQTVHAARTNASLLLHRSGTTLEGAALGLAAAVVAAIAMAVAVVRWPVMEHVILTYALLSVMVITVFSLLIAVIQGFESTPPEMKELGDIYNTPFHRRVRLALIPGATGSLLQGLRVAAPLAILGSLLAEWLDGFPGIGSLMILAQADQEVQLLMATALTAVVLSLLAFAAVEVATAFAAQRGYRVDELSAGSV